MSSSDPTPTGRATAPVPDPDAPFGDVNGGLLMNRQVAALFGVGASTVARWGSQGLITYLHTPGGARRYPAEQFRHLLDDA
ncbi:hypothetical protein Nans01_17170 [Nocardiopsis ansamitocini]|uniref:MerR family transcriptional regulator n=1 Tax=Nocardiopsis ansamitocini TaxID=1670832 RepID=A0A9W6P574_9ACTN|nr:hypothetical protein Nans01_17170 [Nocardiopsis ansamitocini]